MIPRILIIGPSWVGDLIMTQALVRTLLARHPDAQIDVMAPPWGLDVLKRMPGVRQAIALPIGHGRFGLFDRIKLGRSLRPAQYDQAIVLPNSWKSALIPWIAGIPIRTGFFGECRLGLLNDLRRCDRRRWPQMVHRFIALGHPADVPFDPTSGVLWPQLLTTAAGIETTLKAHEWATPQTPVLALIPGAAYGESKRWPAAFYGRVANTLLQDGWDVWLMGSKDDEPVLHQIQHMTQGRATVFGQQTTLDQKIDLLSLATCVVSNDSGLLHAAAALGKPTIGIYGSTSSDFAPPLCQTHAILERKDLACRPCKLRQCPLSGDAFMACLRGIPPEAVLTWIRTHVPTRVPGS
jgi:heptosyltransferase II